MNKSKRWMIAIGLFDALVPTVAILAVVYLDLSRAWYSVAAILVGMTTFFVFLWNTPVTGGSRSMQKGGLRVAILASMIALYISIVGTVAYWVSSEGSTTQLPDISEMALSHFNTIVGIIVVFYFGSSAAESIFKKDEDDEKPAKGEEDKA